MQERSQEISGDADGDMENITKLMNRSEPLSEKPLDFVRFFITPGAQDVTKLMNPLKDQHMSSKRRISTLTEFIT